MAYVVVSFKGEEVGRWPLNGPVSVGRSTECDVVVRDVLLSREHCRIEPYRQGWVAIDLGSKNGTKCEGRPIARWGLTDGDVLTMGKTAVRFQMGRLAAGHKPPPKRPADPFEALSGTVADFDPSQVDAYRRENNLPLPRPVPKEPDAYATEDLYGLLSEIVSSSWDSIYEQASRPKRPIPRVRAFRGGAGGGGVATATAVSVSPSIVNPARPRQKFAEELQAGVDRPLPVRPRTPPVLANVATEPLNRPGVIRRMGRAVIRFLAG